MDKRRRLIECLPPQKKKKKKEKKKKIDEEEDWTTCFLAFPKPFRSSGARLCDGQINRGWKMEMWPPDQGTGLFNSARHAPLQLVSVQMWHVISCLNLQEKIVPGYNK